MNSKALNKEHEVLIVMRQLLGRIVRDTTPEHQGLKHPLSDGTISDIKHAFMLISAREREMADEAGITDFAKPMYPDSERKSQQVGFTVVKNDEPG
ncbi:MAG: segregation and condensation protein A [Gammaproteobacteria bacterium]